MSNLRQSWIRILVLQRVKHTTRQGINQSLNFKRTKRNTPVTNMTWKYNFVKLTLRNVKFNTSNQKLSKLRHEEQNL